MQKRKEKQTFEDDWTENVHFAQEEEQEDCGWFAVDIMKSGNTKCHNDYPQSYPPKTQR